MRNASIFGICMYFAPHVIVPDHSDETVMYKRSGSSDLFKGDEREPVLAPASLG
jgi:hypothetical protein